MLTPQDVRAAQFEKNIRGYRTEEVDRFLGLVPEGEEVRPGSLGEADLAAVGIRQKQGHGTELVLAAPVQDGPLGLEAVENAVHRGLGKGDGGRDLGDSERPFLLRQVNQYGKSP